MAYPKIALDGAVVAITGGARGIGKAAADLFADKRRDGLHRRSRCGGLANCVHRRRDLA